MLTTFPEVLHLVCGRCKSVAKGQKTPLPKQSGSTLFSACFLCLQRPDCGGAPPLGEKYRSFLLKCDVHIRA